MKRNKAVIAFITILAITILTTFSLRHSGVRPGSHLLPESAPQPAISESSHSPGAEPSARPTEAEKSSGHADAPQPIQASPELREAIAREAAETGQQREAYDQPGEAAEFYRLKRVPGGEKYVPVERYLAAREQMRRMPRYSTTQNRLLPAESDAAAESASEANLLGAWTPLGPGNIGGRTRALLIDPTNPQVMYAAGVTGGVWKTINGGAMWTPLADLIANIAVSALVMDPKNPNVIYAGTGEGVTLDFRGAGIFRTIDGGASWQYLTSTGTSDFYFVNDLIISPTNSQRIYAATTTGLWRSTDGGGNWTKLFDPQLNGGCLDLAIRTDLPTDYLFASCGTVFGLPSNGFNQAKVFRNPDAAGAGAWTEVLSQPGMSRTSLAIAPSNQNIIYALAASNGQSGLRHGLLGVFRSTSSGDPDSWTTQVSASSPDKLSSLLLTNPLLASLSECGLGPNRPFAQGWYDNVIAVDPVDPNRVWAGGIDLFRSVDGGASWGLASYWWADKTAPQYAHADQHVIAFHPQYNGATNQTMFVGGDGGIFRTDNAQAAVATGMMAACNPGNGSVAWTSLNNGYAVTQFYHGLPFPDGQAYFGGTQDNGTVRGTEAEGSNAWREILGGDGGFVAVDPHNPQILYATTPGLSIRKSTNGGMTFSPATFGLSDTGLFVSPVVMDASDPQRLWTGGNVLWRTGNGAANWLQASDRLGSVSAIAIAPTDSNVVVAGNLNGTIFRSERAWMTNSFTSWVQSRPRAGFVSWLAFDPANKNIAYATYSTFGGTHVWRSSDGGITWSGLDGFGATGLPDLPVNCIVVDPNNSARLYVGTDLGVFASLDGGSTWAVENTGFANVNVAALVISNVAGQSQLFAFTHGRGAWRTGLGPGPCSHRLSDTGKAFNADGGVGSVQVAPVTGSCHWTATSNADWITLTSDSSGTGTGVISYSVASNAGSSERTGTITIAGRSYAVTQAGRLKTALDTFAPVIRITAPTTANNHRTESAVISLSGTASDNFAVTEVTWNNQRGGSGTANGTSTWMVSALPLHTGVNPITVTARDERGNTSSAAISILRTISASAPVPSVITIAGGSLSVYAPEGSVANPPRLGDPVRIATDAAGHVYIADRVNLRICRYSPITGATTVIAGYKPIARPDSTIGDGGPALNALIAPEDIATDQAGNIYVVEAAHRIRKIRPDGIITTIAGTGTYGFSGDGGPATSAQLNLPKAVAVDHAGNVYISDVNNRRLRRVDAQTGIITTILGDGIEGTSGDDGPALNARVRYCYGLSATSNGDLYFSDAFARTVRKISARTGLVTRVVGLGDGLETPIGDGGPALSARLSFPTGLAFDAAGNLYIAEGWRARRVSVTTGLIETVAGGGPASPGDGSPATLALLSLHHNLAIDPSGHLLFAHSNRVRRVVPFSIPDPVPPQVAIPGGQPRVTVQLCCGSIRGTASDNYSLAYLTWSANRPVSANFRPDIGTGSFELDLFRLLPGPTIITFTAWDGAGNTGSASIELDYQPGVPPRIGRIISGGRGSGFSGDQAQSNEAQLWSPEAVAADAAGNLYVADTGNHRVRRISPDGVITTFAGSGQLGYAGDGGQATAAALNTPRGLAVDAAGNVYIADTNNHCVRKVTPDGIITTVAGNGLPDFSGDGGQATAASLREPTGLFPDRSGNLYIADTGNHRIRRVSLSSGVIATVAGSGFGTSGDGGPAAAAQFNTPTSVAVASDGTMYVAEASRVRRAAPDGTVTTWVSHSPGPGGFNESVTDPRLTLDDQGNLYLADRSASRILVINQDRSTSYLSGSLIKPNGEYDTTGSSNPLGLLSPSGLAVDRAGNVFVADTGNHRVVGLMAWRNVVSVSAASYDGNAVAAEEIVAAFGASLATRIELASALPLPTTLAGTTVRIRDRAGVERAAPLFFVSPQQVNYLIPPETAPGSALVFINSGDTTVSTGTLQVRSTAPGLFTANATGEGIAAALVLRIRADQSQVYEPVVVFDQAQHKFIARPIDLSHPSDQVFLLLFGTGLRGRDQKIPVTASIGDENLEALYAGPQGGFIGLDQVNLRLPHSLAGRGETELKLTVDQQTTNAIRISFAGTPCASSINPTAQQVSAAGGNLNVNVSATACAWSAFSRESWIRISAGGSGTSHGIVSLEILPNTRPAHRTGSVRIAGQTLTITQNGAGDTSPPVIKITSPTSTGAYQTGAQATSLKGTVSASNGVALLTWSNDRGGSGLLAGAPEWTIEGIALQPGLNQLTVTAYDNAGRTGSAKFAVTQAQEFRIITFAGGGTNDPGDGGQATAAELFPAALATDQQGNLYIASNNRIRKVTPSGLITTIVGGGNIHPGSNSPAIGAQIGDVRGMAADQNGDLYFSSYSVGWVWKLPAGASTLTLLAGAGSGGDGGPAYSARVLQPGPLALDGRGSLYIAENSKIRKINLATTIISTIAGGNILPSGNGDGGLATAASVSIPDGLTIDSAGNIYLSEYYSQRVRKIDARTGIITTVIGGGALPPLDGYLGTSIQLNYPAGIAIDSNDNLYLAVTSAQRVLRFDPRTGTIMTVAGNGTAGFSGDGGPAINAQFNLPTDVAIDRAGRIYIGDWNNKRVRQLIPF